MGVEMEIQEKDRLSGVRREVAYTRRKDNSSTAEKKLGPCQVRSRTDCSCPYPAVVEICGVPFCKRCAREQRAYFEIGELTRALETRGVREQTERARWELVRARKQDEGAQR